MTIFGILVGLTNFTYLMVHRGLVRSPVTFSFGLTWLFLFMQQNFVCNHNRFIGKAKKKVSSIKFICSKLIADYS